MPITVVTRRDANGKPTKSEIHKGAQGAKLVDGHLLLRDKDKRTIAAYAPTAWVSWSRESPKTSDAPREGASVTVDG